MYSPPSAAPVPPPGALPKGDRRDAAAVEWERFAVQGGEHDGRGYWWNGVRQTEPGFQQGGSGFRVLGVRV